MSALLGRIYAWRSAEAEQLRMAPATILPDYRAKQIAYSQVQTVDGLKSLGARETDAAAHPDSSNSLSSGYDLWISHRGRPGVHAHRAALFLRHDPGRDDGQVAG
jgi:hypothetical protein